MSTKWMISSTTMKFGKKSSKASKDIVHNAKLPAEVDCGTSASSVADLVTVQSFPESSRFEHFVSTIGRAIRPVPAGAHSAHCKPPPEVRQMAAVGKGHSAPLGQRCTSDSDGEAEPVKSGLICSFRNKSKRLSKDELARLIERLTVVENEKNGKNHRVILPSLRYAAYLTRRQHQLRSFYHP